MNMFGIALALLFTSQVLCQRRELETNLLALAKAHVEVTTDHPDQSVDVSVSLMLTNINDFNPQTQLLDANGWLDLQWTDEHLSWNPADYGNLSIISLPCKDVPKPDIKLFFGAHAGVVVNGDFNCAVTSKGHITYIPQVSIHEYCAVQNPISDTFTCHLQFGSWTHPCKDLSINKEHSKLDISVFQSNWRFEILNHSSEVISKKYDCCPETYCKVDMEIEFKDHSRTPNSKYYFFSHYN